MKGMASRSKWEIISSHIFTYFNFLNLVLAGLILLSGQYKNMLFMGIVITNAFIGIIQELKVKKIIDALAVVTATKARRYRGGEFCQCDIEELCPGDRILLMLGDQIPVDCEILSTDGMEVNESLLTGESLAVQKKKGDFVYSGSDVVAGSAVAKVVHIGEDNYATQLVKKAKTKRRATSEMQDAIGRIIKYVSYVLIPVGILLFFIQWQSAGNSFSDSVVNTVAGVIGMIPEGLVLLTSISFILGVGRLAKKNALVQEMEAIEALARVDVLCLDKTGTITTGELQVEKVVPLSERENVNAIMGTLSYAFEESNATTTALRKYFDKTEGKEIVEKVPFSSSRKQMQVKIQGEGVYCLGAPEYLSEDRKVLQDGEKYAAEGMRVLLLTHNKKEIAFIVLSDIIKSDAAETFSFFRKKEVDIKILSGDNPLTVSVVGRRAGLPEAARYVDARTLPEEEEKLREEIGKYTVFGRVSPEKKQAIVKALEAEGKVTGMVGDGVNDVLALKEADCGIAMAAGSDAAKQIAHIVLLDSDFASMKQIVGEGRTIISNIERVSALYLTKTIYSVLLCIIYIVLGMSYPFIPIQLSLIGGTAIGIPSFVLALEHHEETIPRGFLRNVLRVSLPAAICMVGSLVTITLLGGVFHFSELVLSTLHLLAGGIVSFGVLIAVCIPMSRIRFGLCVIVIAIFVGAILLFPDFFGMAPVMHLVLTLPR
ncbi:MAG: HAD-IC family P-type ATPase [Clostridiales bacterium]|nr:HAD-IC family P-type ATPase [Clostridiales bacterium]